MEMSEVGKAVYERTYSRTKPDGSKESWPETVERVVDGNLALVPEKYHAPNEREDLVRMMTEFKLLPAGRHLWASGVKGAQHLMNCWVSGWEGPIWDHFEFTFMRLMEGGGVGANYSNRFIQDYPLIQHFLQVEIVCDPSHRDYEALKEAGVLSERYSPDWDGAFVIEDSREGWAAALVDLIQTHYRPEVQNYYRVYDVSRVRPAGARLKTFGGTASGPLPLAQMLIEVCRILSIAQGEKLTGLFAMEIDHAIAQCVVAGGVRRSARMAMMHWNDPQIMDFIRIKQDSGSHWTTNISVEVDSDFWIAVEGHPDIAISDEIIAEDVLKAISEGMVHNGEPGIWDSSLSNEGEPNEVVCTNPCGEITLEAWEPCNLGHVNLAAFVDDLGMVDEFEIYHAHELMTRFLIRATFAAVSDHKSREVLDRNRRIGVGHLGVASYLAMRGIRYSEAPDDWGFGSDLRYWAQAVDAAAVEYSHQLRIPVPVKRRTVAPTGTIAKMPGVSEGIHPIFSKYFIRRIRFSKLDPDQAATLEQYRKDGYHVEDCQYAANTAVVEIPTKDSLVQAVEDIYDPDMAEELVQGADELALAHMLNMQALYQKYWSDNAVSYTANIEPDYDPTLLSDLLRSYGGALKGATVFPESSMGQAPYQIITREEYEAATAKDVSDGVDEECSSGACPIR